MNKIKNDALAVFIAHFRSEKHCIAPPALASFHAMSNQPPTEKRQRMKIFYTGRVKGVGFRYAVKSAAAGFEIAGIVRNLPDGRVELIVEGARAELEAFRAAIRDAGLAGFIRDENVTWSDAQNEFRGFEIVH